MTVLIVTHDQEVSAQVRRTVQIRDGRTSTEVLRSTRTDEFGVESQHAQEFAVLDRVGRLQLPPDYLTRLSMRDRVRLELRRGPRAGASDEPGPTEEHRMIGDVVIRCEGLSRSYGSGENEVHALIDAELEVRSGELLVLRGPSGSGKTTLLNLLGGLDTPTAGHVWLGDREVTGASEAELIDMRRRELGYIFQTFALLPVLSAAENVELPLRILDVPADERDARVAGLLEIVGLAAHANQRPNELSGGQQQRLGIARALANDPRLLIADEPTGQLDSTNAEAMMSLIAALVHQRGRRRDRVDPRPEDGGARRPDHRDPRRPRRRRRRRGRHATDAAARHRRSGCRVDATSPRASGGVEREPAREAEQHRPGDPVEPGRTAGRESTLAPA